MFSPANLQQINRNSANFEKKEASTPPPGNLAKVENSIHKIQNMLQHMDGILAKFNSFKRNSELLEVAENGDDSCHQQSSRARDYTNRESDLVTLLNCDDLSDFDLDQADTSR